MTPSPNPVALERALREHEKSVRSGVQWVVGSCRAPSGLSRVLMDAQIADHAVYFSSGRGSSGGADDREDEAREFVGLGAAVLLRFEGEARFRQAEQAISETFSRLSANEGDLAYLRFFGGASFSPRRNSTENCWGDFGDATFLLPSVTYADLGSEARFIVVSPVGKVDEPLALLSRLIQLSHIHRPETGSIQLRAVKRTESESPASWDELIRSIQESIAGGKMEKIVAARRVTLQLNAAPQLSDILERMNAQAPLCARFALRIGQRTFLGATPERLVARTKNRVFTEALAGSIGASVPGASERLLGSVKDQHEHAYVVQAISSCLGAFCDRVELSQAPEVRALRHVLHLRTPIEGYLKSPVHVLRLVEALHPTPAVGGLPREPAVHFIESHERAERGWYAAPVGWVNAQGEGQFVVALRSGLIHGDKVHLYAGAGIVAESNAGDEFVETELKLSGMLGALGVEH